MSLDLDDLWTYLRTRGDPAWTSRPSYLPVFVPLVLDLLDRLDVRITFFAVGEDVVRQANRGCVRAIAERGHEVASHSYSHEPWLHLRPRADLREDLRRTEEAIADVCGRRPVGYRGPGYSWSTELLEVLGERGYLYDASTLPTFLAPLARWYFLARTGLSGEERRERRRLFGAFRDGFRPVGAYQWRLSDGRDLLEIPVTTMPVLRTPFHMSYLLYLARYSERLMRGYLRAALGTCRAAGVSPSFLLHPLDLLGAKEAPGLDFFPGMDLPPDRKYRLVTSVITMLGREFRLVPLAEHARSVLGTRRKLAEAVV